MLSRANLIPASGVRSLLLLGLLLLPCLPAHAENGEDMRPRAFRYQKCRDATVAKLVGLGREPAMKRVVAMRLMQVRVLDPGAPVSFEVVPERLTLVIGYEGVVQRAFCR